MPAIRPQSISRRMFSAVRNLVQEAHPFERYPTTTAMHRLPGASYYLNRVSRTAGVFVPFYAFFFGWPFLTQYAINTKNHV